MALLLYSVGHSWRVVSVSGRFVFSDQTRAGSYRVDDDGNLVLVVVYRELRCGLSRPLLGRDAERRVLPHDSGSSFFRGSGYPVTSQALETSHGTGTWHVIGGAHVLQKDGKYGLDNSHPFSSECRGNYRHLPGPNNRTEISMQALKELIYSISAANILDITIIGCLIYFVLAWLQGTRAFQILTTLLGIGLFYLAASATGLILTSILFQYLWAAIIVVLVIVFQPEIREMLDRASPIRYLSGRQPEDVKPDIIDEIVRAVADLARVKIGGLIVFQRLDRLDNLMLKGKLLDSLVSAEALVMIFQKTSPLHDGAILISRDRIKAASCVLPLSQNEDLGPHYGMRHRAALGLTEKSDAVCVVVSEERGEVSLVEGKEITSYKKKGEFRQALERWLVPGRTPQAGATSAR